MKAKLFTLIPLVAALAACGGGGSDNGGVDLPSTPAGTTSSALVTAVPAATYTAGSEELAAFTLLNAERQRCGFGLLAQKTTLDVAARGHADWNLINSAGGTVSHFQTAGTAGFTGVSAADRAVAAGYVTNAFDATLQDEFVFLNGLSSKAGLGQRTIRELLNAPYHASSLIGGFKDVGISIRTATEAGAAITTRVTGQVNPAFKASEGAQLPEAGTVLSYPCNGTTGVVPVLYNESPNPVPGRDLQTNPLGSSIQVMIREGQTIAISSATMTNLATNAPVTLRAPTTAANDPNNFLRSHQAFISANAPLQSSTSYQVSFSGTANGASFGTRTFSFTTGSDPYGN